MSVATFALICAACLTLVAEAAVFVDQTRNSTNCDKLLLDTDRCVRRVMLVGERSVAIPRTADELTNGHCKRVKKDIPCMRNYGSRCLRTLPRTIFNVGYKNAIKLYKRICFSDEGREEYLRHVQCMQPEQLIIVHQYMDEVTTYMDYIEANVTSDEIVPYLCCSYFKVFEHALRDLQTYCSGRTGPQTVDFILGLVKSLSSDMIDIGCGKYSTVQSCNEHLPVAMKVFETIEVTKKDYSPVVPAIKIIKRLDLD